MNSNATVTRLRGKVFRVHPAFHVPHENAYVEVAFVERILRVLEPPLSHGMNHWPEGLSGLGEMPLVAPSECPLLDQASFHKFVSRWKGGSATSAARRDGYR